jgi:hypothetical protein
MWMVRSHLSRLDLTLVPSHDKEMARGRAALGACRSGQRGSAEEYVVGCTAGSTSRARGNVGESLLPPLFFGETEPNDLVLTFLDQEARQR